MDPITVAGAILTFIATNLNSIVSILGFGYLMLRGTANNTAKVEAEKAVRAMVDSQLSNPEKRAAAVRMAMSTIPLQYKALVSESMVSLLVEQAYKLVVKPEQAV
jgi:hypothetical protein